MTSIDSRLDPYAGLDNPSRANAIQNASAFRQPHHPQTEPGLSIVILNLNKPELIIPLLKDLTKAAAGFAGRGYGFEVLVGDTGSTNPAVLECYRAARAPVRIVKGLKYQFSRCNNQVFYGEARFDTVLFLNNDIIISDNIDGILAMYEHMRANPKVGVTGLTLLFADRTIQHAGVDVFRSGPLKGFCYHPHARETLPPTAAPVWSSPAVTGACLMIRSEIFVRVGGFDEDYQTECQDVALCLAARRLGYDIQMLNAGEIIHLENATRPKGSEDWDDRRRYMRRWASFLEATLF